MKATVTDGYLLETSTSTNDANPRGSTSTLYDSAAAFAPMETTTIDHSTHENIFFKSTSISVSKRKSGRVSNHAMKEISLSKHSKAALRSAVHSFGDSLGNTSLKEGLQESLVNGSLSFAESLGHSAIPSCDPANQAAAGEVLGHAAVSSATAAIRPLLKGDLESSAVNAVAGFSSSVLHQNGVPLNIGYTRSKSRRQDGSSIVEESSRRLNVDVLFPNIPFVTAGLHGERTDVRVDHANGGSSRTTRYGAGVHGNLPGVGLGLTQANSTTETFHAPVVEGDLVKSKYSRKRRTGEVRVDGRLFGWQASATLFSLNDTSYKENCIMNKNSKPLEVRHRSPGRPTPLPSVTRSNPHSEATSSHDQLTNELFDAISKRDGTTEQVFVRYDTTQETNDIIGGRYSTKREFESGWSVK